MKDTGIIRKVDELGRVVIPIEIRNNLKIEEGDKMEIYVQGRNIVLKKVNKYICEECNNEDIELEDNYCKRCGAKLWKN